MMLSLDTEQTMNVADLARSEPFTLEKIELELKNIENKIDDCFQPFILDEPILSTSSIITLNQENKESSPTSTNVSTDTPYQSTESHKSNESSVSSSQPRTPTSFSFTPKRINLYRAASSYLSINFLSSENLGPNKKLTKKESLPITKESLAVLRQETSQNQDPRVQLEFAQRLLETASQVTDDDPEKTRATREQLTMEAQTLIKELASRSGRWKQGYPEAQFFLANCYGTGSMGLAVDPEKAFGLYVHGSKQQHPQCTFRAAVCYEVGAGTKRDTGHAMQLYRKAANLGDPFAMYKLGIILLKGFLHQSVSPREGIIWLKRAAEHAQEDYPHPLHELGLVYEKEGIPSIITDVNYARELFTQAARFGYAPSQFKLGQAYECGLLNCPVDSRRSIAWYSKAAEQGMMDAEFALSGWYLTGADGILPQNDGEAYMWALKAANQGYSKAEYAVGYYYETGTGISQDMKEATKWYKRAASHKHTKAMQRLAELEQDDSQWIEENDFELNRRERNSECMIM